MKMQSLPERPQISALKNQILQLRHRVLLSLKDMVCRHVKEQTQAATTEMILDIATLPHKLKKASTRYSKNPEEMISMGLVHFHLMKSKLLYSS
jgi:hypothetical protein